MGSSTPPPHYFSPSPGTPSRPATSCGSTCPTCRSRCAPTGACSPPSRVDPAPSSCCSRRRAPPATGDLLDLGCGYGPIALTLARRAPDATVWAVDVNERALDLRARPTPAAAGLANVRAADARRGARRRALRRALVEPADPDRQARPPRAARHAGSPGWRPAATAAAGGAEAPGRRLAARWLARAGLGRRAPRQPRWPTGCSTSGRKRTATERPDDPAARLHRPQAPAPRAGGAGPPGGSACCSTTCSRRSTSASSCAPRPRCRVEHLWLVGDTASPTNAKTAKTALGSQRYLDWTWHDTAADAVAAARADGYRIVGVELADDAVPLPELAVDGPVVPGDRPRGPGAVPGLAGRCATPWRSSPSWAGSAR